MSPDGAFAITCQVGDRFLFDQANGRHGWQKAKALVVLAASAPGGWGAACLIADAFKFNDETKLQIYRELYGDEPVTHTLQVTVPAGGPARDVQDVPWHQRASS